ncbi:MAG: MFS transporter [Phycisphaerae bacterium]
MPTTPTNTERMKRLPWWFAAGMLDNVRISLVFGPVFVLFLDAIKIGKAGIGVLLAMPLLFQAVSIFAVPLVERLGYKKSCLIFFSVRTSILFGLLLTPLFLQMFGIGGAFLWVAFIMLVFSISFAIGLTAGGPWGLEVLPTNIRSKIIAINTFLCGAVVILGTWFAGFWLSKSKGLPGFMFLIATGAFVGLFAVASHAMFPGGGKIKKQTHSTEHLKNMLDALKDGDFLRLLVGIGVFIFIVQGVASFIPLYMKNLVGIDNSRVVYLGIWQNAGILLAVYFWGWCADRFGGKPVFITGIMFHIFLPVLWYLIPRHHGDTSYYIAAVVSFLTGLMCVAYLIGIDRYFFLTAMPHDKKTSYYAVWFGWTGLLAGLGPIVVGLALKWCAPLDNIAANLHIRVDSFLPVFLAHMLLPAIGMYIFRNIKRDSELTTTQFVGQLFQSMPFGLFGSISSIMRYRMAGEENERIVTTRNLGRSDSPFNTDELIEALSDPSFDVRYEAVLAMALRKPDQKIVAALLGVLEGEDIELSATASWALGQIGDKSAVAALKKQLTAPYRILRARSARALGSIGDKETADIILELLKIETDSVLRVAYASALGAMRYVPAIEYVLSLLADVQNETFRGEVALAAARIVGSEKSYIKLLRSSAAEWSTTLSGAILKLKKPMVRLNLDPALIDSVGACAESFAAEQHGWAIELLWPILEAMPKDLIDTEYRKALAECGRRIEQFGSQRKEYIILAVHTCDVWLRARCAAKAYQAE